ncbi:MAG: BlaI/MecI/CopY family transcriptional regulator [Candidatus Bathyarchaeota archaeon]|nr:MAG: BlaI/MecI/CopY family transcriptional regulator [Candidatus Bathyarchaeota archaeon]
MSVFKFDPAKKGLRKTLREYEELALRFIWSVGEEGSGSGKTWDVVNRQLGSGNSISRASIIFFLNRMVEQGVLDFRDATGKGGHHRIYFPILNEREYRKYVLKTIVQSMLRDFPEETKEALKEIL